MGRHLADHRSASKGGRLVRFLAIERGGEAREDRGPWQRLARRPQGSLGGGSGGNRRLVEFLRIARGRTA